MKIKLLGSIAILSLTATAAFADSYTRLEKRAQDSTFAFSDWSSLRNEFHIPRNLMAHAECFIVIPHLSKVAFIFGARHGAGLASCRMENGLWSNPVYFNITGVSAGFQLGIQTSDTVLVFTTPSAIHRLSRGNITLGADLSIAVGPVGRQAEASTDWLLRSQIYSYSRDRGLFAGISLEGARLAADKSDNRAVYGSYIPMDQQVMLKDVAPAILRDFVRTLNRNASF